MKWKGQILILMRAVSQCYGYLWKYDILFLHFYPILSHSMFYPPHFQYNFLLFCDSNWFGYTVRLVWYHHRDVRVSLVRIWLPDMSDQCFLAFRESPSVFTILTDCVWLFPGHLQTRRVHCGGARWTHQRTSEGKSESASFSTNTGRVSSHSGLYEDVSVHAESENPAWCNKIKAI